MNASISGAGDPAGARPETRPEAASDIEAASYVEAGPASAPGPAPLTRHWSRALVAGTAVAVVAVLGAHLSATFLYNAPANPLSQRYAKQVQRWMEPLFSQNWHLFAPNPLSENVSVQARASLAPDGRLTGWVDLSAQDRAAVLGDPVPGHLVENELRNAWFEWLATHDAGGEPTGDKAAIMQRYLLNVVVDRMRGQAAGPIGSVQIRAITTLIPGPGRTAAQTAPQTRTLDWWTVPAGVDANAESGSDPGSGSPGSGAS
jgi:hypothetical protein